MTAEDVVAMKVTNTASGSADEVPEPKNATFVVTPVEPSIADLSLNKRVSDFDRYNDDSSGTLTPGDEVNFTITLTNQEISIPTGTATGVVVRDQLNSRYAYLSDDSNGTYDPRPVIGM